MIRTVEIVRNKFSENVSVKNIIDKQMHNYFNLYHKLSIMYKKQHHIETFKSLVWQIYFDDYKLFRISEYYDTPNTYNISNESCYEEYNTISNFSNRRQYGDSSNRW